MAVTASMVKELRDSTGAGMMDAKKALTETDGDMDAALDWLRTKGLAKAAKKAGRTAAEGLVAVVVEGGKGVAVEVNSETDFVGKNDDFQKMVGAIATAALGVDDLDALKAAKIGGKTVEETVTEAIATIGENMTLRRMGKVEGGQVLSYVHNAVAPGMGKIGVLVAMDGGSEDFGRQVAMHIAAADPRPQALNEAGLDPAVMAKELEIQTAKALEENAASAKPKPEQVIHNNIIPGRMKKFVADISLLDQQFVVSADKITVAEAAKQNGATITGFVRFEVGEGIEVVKEDFAAEVAKAVKG
ncbi:MAG: elongation factor Ts [Pseudooceanicola sp.]|nr:elongation factor Ts [Pseudooceanicola sp.]